MEQKTAVITGASSGIGKETAALFAAAGYRVYDLSRHGTDKNGITHIRTDVTSPESTAAALARIFEETRRVDVLVCCAGMGVSGPVEFLPETELHWQTEVNFYGTVHTVQAALPYMRKSRGGRIICLSSVAAVYAIPYQAYYSASKAAVNAFADALGNEVRQFGISVCAVMPGDIATGFTAARRKTTLGAEIYPRADAAVKKMEHDERNGMPPARVAALILKLAEKKKVAPLYTVGASYKTLVFLSRLFPKAFASKIVGGMYR